MLGLFRALVWLRWRHTMNALQRTGRRGRLERASTALESLAPMLAALLLVPALVLSSVFGLVAGWMLATGAARAPVVATLVRVAALAAVVVSVAAPLVSAAGRSPAETVRLLLLPIPRRALYAGELLAALADPWILVTVPLFLALPVGALLSAHPAAAATTAAASSLLLLVVSGLSVLATSVSQLLLRRRRVAELVGLLVAFLPLVFAALPHWFDRPDRRGGPDEPRVRVEAPSGNPADLPPPAFRPVAILPPELYTAVAARAPRDQAAVGLALAGLAAWAVAIHAAAGRAHRTLLASPATSAVREQHSTSPLWARRLPGLSTAASSVATATLRLTVRTPRGRMILLTPFVLTAFLALVASTGGAFRFGSAAVDPGLGLAIAVALLGLVAPGPIALNQFAIDGPGFTLELLAPMRDADLVTGKAAAVAIVTGAPTLGALAVAAIVVPPASHAFWLAVVFALVAALGVLLPVWAMLSALFPRAATLTSLKNRASNPHQAAHFAGLGALAVTAMPPIVLAVLARGPLDRPALVLPLLAVWAVVAWLAGLALFRPAITLVGRRRETLGLVASGRV